MQQIKTTYEAHKKLGQERDETNETNKAEAEADEQTMWSRIIICANVAPGQSPSLS